MPATGSRPVSDAPAPSAPGAATARAARPAVLDFFWTRYFGLMVGVSALAATIGGLFGAAWGWGVLSLTLAAVVLHHVRHLAMLLQWLRAPSTNTIPEATGAWEDAYAGLYRMLRRQQQSTSRLSATVDDFVRAGAAIPDGLVILDTQDRIEWCNPRAQLHLGLDFPRDQRQNITYLVRQPRFAEYLRSGRYEEPVVLRHTRTGERILAVQLVPYGDRQKLVISRDITDLERVETMRRDFVANVSHELRTPLTVLCGFLETLVDAREQDRQRLLERSLPLMSSQARRMERLVADLLTLSRLESGNYPVREERIDVPALVRSLYEEAVELAAGRHRIVLEEMSAAMLRGAEDELRSAFGNLVSNAVRYTPDGGTITLSWRESGGVAVFSVRDTGIGIEEQHIPRLTERFYRVDRSRSRETGGTGLGLAIVKHVLQRHEGALEVDSAPGRGSTFNAVFRGSRVQAQEAAAEPSRGC